MIFFFLRKNFYDGWDCLFSLLPPNLFVNSLFFSIFYAAYLTRNSLTSWIILFLLLLFVYCLCSISLAFCASSLLKGDIHSAPFSFFRAFLKNLIASFKDALIFFALNLLLILASFCAYILFFRATSSILSLSAGFCYLYLFFFLFLVLRYYPALSASMRVSPIRKLKTALLIVMDNPFSSLFFFFYSLFLGVLSIFFLGFIPGLAGLAVAKENETRLFLKKYDFISSKKIERKKFTWSEILKKEKEAMPDRSFKDFLFPWK